MWLIVISFVVISFLLYNLFRVINKYKAILKTDVPNILDRIAIALSTVIKHRKILEFMMYDIKLLYFAFFAKTQERKDTAQLYTHHKSSTFKIVTIVLSIIVVIESIGIHFLLHYLLVAKSSNVLIHLLPWLLHILNAYLFIVMIAHNRAMKLVPHSIVNNVITINFGIFGSAQIPLCAIASIEKARQLEIGEKQDKSTFYAHNTMDTPQIHINFNQSIIVQLPYGRKNNSNSIVLFLDEPQLFVSDIKRLQDESC